MPSPDPTFQEFHGRAAVDREMLPPPVVKGFKVVEQVCLRGGPFTGAATILTQGVSREICRRYFRISISSLSRRFSTRTGENSICSSATGFVQTPFSLSSSNDLTRSYRVCSIRPSSFAIATAVWPAFNRFAASSRNSGVYSCCGFVFNFASTSNITEAFYPVSWKTSLREGGLDALYYCSVSIWAFAYLLLHWFSLIT